MAPSALPMALQGITRRRETAYFELVAAGALQTPATVRASQSAAALRASQQQQERVRYRSRPGPTASGNVPPVVSGKVYLNPDTPPAPIRAVSDIWGLTPVGVGIRPAPPPSAYPAYPPAPASAAPAATRPTGIAATSFTTRGIATRQQTSFSTLSHEDRGFLRGLIGMRIF